VLGTPPLTVSAWLRWHEVQRFLPVSSERVLDIGAGGGSLGSLLAERYDYVGIEPDRASYAKAKRRVGVLGQVVNCSFEAFEPDEQFDLVCAFEVLEHVEDDAAAVQRWVRHLRPGGWLLVTVPQGRNRFGPGDARMGHLRRYDPEGLTELMECAGLCETTTAVFGSPWGNVEEAIRNVAFRVRPSEQTVAERTAESGRFLHPPDWAAGVVRGVSIPLRYLQRPFSRRGIGTGLIALGRLRPSRP
jgi:SAM-dependent methyltransferase